ncbi:MAG: 50S ribosomal protein L11 methyltransferase [Bryobacteraceae bacterium]
MYSLRITCCSGQVDYLSGELWETGTSGIHELSSGDSVVLIAAFETNEHRGDLLRRFARYAPEWEHENGADWVQYTRDAWPARTVGAKLFLAPHWCSDPTPEGRDRIIHNPGQACGTGEHPCTELALRALEECVTIGSRVIDVGTGSGIVAIAAKRLGAGLAIGMDIDEASLQAARENFLLNDLTPQLVVGSAEAGGDACVDITVANISGTVLLSILAELLRITRANGCLILTGFAEEELPVLRAYLPGAIVSAISEWRCIVATVS